MNSQFVKALQPTAIRIPQRPTNKDLQIEFEKQHKKLLAEKAKREAAKREADKVKRDAVQKAYLNKPFAIPTRAEMQNAVGHWIWNDNSINEIGGLAYDKFVAPALKEIQRLHSEIEALKSH